MVQVKILRSKEVTMERDINECLRKFTPYPNCQVVNITSSYIAEKGIYQSIIIYNID